MLNNAGKKIILWSKVLLYVGVGLSVLAGIWCIWNGAQASAFRYSVYHAGYLYKTGFIGGGRTIIMGILIMAFGSLGSWLCALLLRAFGDLTTDARAIRERLEWAPVETKAEAPTAAKAEKPVRARARKPAEPKAETPEAK